MSCSAFPELGSFADDQQSRRDPLADPGEDANNRVDLLDRTQVRDVNHQLLVRSAKPPAKRRIGPARLKVAVQEFGMTMISL